MGLSLSYIRLLAREHRRKPLVGPVLTLGRQAVHGTLDQIRAALQSEGIAVWDDAAPAMRATAVSSSPSGLVGQLGVDQAVFRLLGLESFALDVSDYEGAEYIADLNQAIPHSLEEQFGTIIDGGTVEHVFDVKQAMQNIARMLAVGGRVVHISPACNWLGHGFYQFSPTLFFDYYGINGFADLRCFILEVRRSSMRDKVQHACRCWEWDVRRPYSVILSSDALMSVFFAEKIPGATYEKVPQQGDFSAVGGGGRTLAPGAASQDGLAGRIKRALPVELRQFVNRALGRDLTRAPWGLRYLGRV